MPITKVNLKLVENILDTDMPNFTYLHPSPLHHITTQNAKRDLLKALSLIELDFTFGLDPVKIARCSLGRDIPVLTSLNSREPKLGDLPDFATRIQALYKVSLHRSYFERLWVLQEMQNSSHAVLLCGARQIDFSMASLLVIATQGPQPSDGAGIILPNLGFSALEKIYQAMGAWIIRYLDRAYNQKRTLAHQIIELSIRKFSEPRDDIYALRGMSLPIEIVTAYDKPVSDIYVEAVRAMISQQQDLMILCLKPRFVGFPEDSKGCPSQSLRASTTRPVSTISSKNRNISR